MADGQDELGSDEESSGQPLIGLEAARQAAADLLHEEHDVTSEDQEDRWIFEFIPRGDFLGGGARVSIAKDGLRVLSVVRGQ